MGWFMTLVLIGGAVGTGVWLYEHGVNIAWIKTKIAAFEADIAALKKKL